MKKNIVVIAVSGAVALALVVCALVYIYRRRKGIQMAKVVDFNSLSTINSKNVIQTLAIRAE